MQPSENIESRSFDYKKGISADDARRKREDGLINLRRANRLEALAKRRQNPLLAPPGAAPKKSEPNISAIVSRLGLADQEEVFKATQELRKLVSNRSNPPIQDVVRLNVIPRLVQLLDCDAFEMLQFEAAWVLTNIASSTTENTGLIFENGALRPLIKLLGSPNVDIAEQAVWALSNMAGDCAAFRDSVLEAGAVEPLLSLVMRSTRQSTARTCAWAISNLCRNKPNPPVRYMRRILPFLVDLLQMDDCEVLTDSAWALSFICDESSENGERIQMVVDSGAVPKVVAKILQPNQPATVKMPLLRVIANVVTGSDSQTQCVLDSRGIDALLALLQEKNDRIRKEVAWMSSNIAAGTPAQMRALMASGIPARFIDGFYGENYDTKREIAWVISNIASNGDFECTSKLVDCGALKVLGDMLTTSDPNVITVAVEGLAMVLRVGEKNFAQSRSPNKWAELVEEIGVLDKIEQLQESENDNVYQSVMKFTGEFFYPGDELEQLKPREEDGAFKFDAQLNSLGKKDGAFDF